DAYVAAFVACRSPAREEPFSERDVLCRAELRRRERAAREIAFALASMQQEGCAARADAGDDREDRAMKGLRGHDRGGASHAHVDGAAEERLDDARPRVDDARLETKRRERSRDASRV